MGCLATVLDQNEAQRKQFNCKEIVQIVPFLFFNFLAIGITCGGHHVAATEVFWRPPWRLQWGFYSAWPFYSARPLYSNLKNNLGNLKNPG